MSSKCQLVLDNAQAQNSSSRTVPRNPTELRVHPLSRFRLSANRPNALPALHWSWFKNMQRCRSCETTIARNETHCINCGTPAVEDTPKKTIWHHLSSGLKIVFILSLGMTAVSIFTSYGPPVTVCAVITAALRLAKNSADDAKAAVVE